MRNFHLFIALLLLMLIPSFASATDIYETKDYKHAKGELYKGVYKADWWITWVLKEFDKLPPFPGSDWMGTEECPAPIDKWIGSAALGGWIVRTQAQEPAIGAIAIRYNKETKIADLAIVSSTMHNSITLIGISNETGKKYIRTFRLHELAKKEKGFKFLGYIWPQKYDQRKEEENKSN